MRLIIVAGQALDLDMLAFQRKACCGVIEFGVGPVIRVVAVGAVSAEIALMDIILNVTRLALLWRIATLAVWLVATFTIGIGVFAQQLEVCPFMVKGRFIEPHDVGAAAFVISMAGCALGISNVGRSTVEPTANSKVLGNILMAVKAQGILLRPVKWFMARRTLRLEFGMPFDEFAWHDKRLDSLSGHSVTCETNHHQHESCQSCTPSIH